MEHPLERLRWDCLQWICHFLWPSVAAWIPERDAGNISLICGLSVARGGTPSPSKPYRRHPWVLREPQLTISPGPQGLIADGRIRALSGQKHLADLREGLWKPLVQSNLAALYCTGGCEWLMPGHTAASD
ncbi:uncharacterized protein SETTUDRAFT_22302 [Exserohilum turcica Et28A]|uniref:Uncharacterized protein n=1 Tax=Exserohilum turcicum (strain 28A) TaxID=671987 RepID=R0K5L2_EXST2|nr:uncharacterized protein SETTUDRAFT_22302 [Exserohilum turcica Et28A]EOA83607.1 hypothetical protein SETTUDRAFT_22302 [Exserohilum turcica Et28A]